jgi:hypothetical protein
MLVDPPPVRSRLCPHCRHRIVVRRFEGRPAYLTEAAVVVFEAERRREIDERGWEIARARWLKLAGSVDAAPARVVRVATIPISAAAVEAARALYASAANHAAGLARREHRWADLGRIRRDQAAALYADAGAPLPPPEDLVALYREGRNAVLRSLAAWAPDAELVGAGCCRACRQDDGQAFRIAQELRRPRLPHPECPKGLCACDWWMAILDQGAGRKRRRGSRPAAGATRQAPPAV